MVTRTRLSVTLYVGCLSGLFNMIVYVTDICMGYRSEKGTG